MKKGKNSTLFFRIGLITIIFFFAIGIIVLGENTPIQSVKIQFSNNSEINIFKKRINWK